MPENQSADELDRLQGFLVALQEQDRLLTEAMQLKQKEVSIPHVGFIKRIFDQIAAYDSGLVHPFVVFADPATSLAQIRDVIPKIQRRIELLNPPRTSIEQSIQTSVNKRCVFVVHGRNESANNALFGFLRAIDLDPIEWDEAIAMTGHGSPYPGDALEAAFSRAQAAVVLLTGDDMARLGTRFLKASDKEHERTLTPQCRPNVLFEAGMAFGKHPERTIIVALGETRPFSDILGRHIIYLAWPARYPVARVVTASASTVARYNHRVKEAAYCRRSFLADRKHIIDRAALRAVLTGASGCNRGTTYRAAARTVLQCSALRAKYDPLRIAKGAASCY